MLSVTGNTYKNYEVEQQCLMALLSVEVSLGCINT